MYSIHRRRERYLIIYTWKILENMVPNVGMQCRAHPRLGRLCGVPYANHRARAAIRNLKNSFISVTGAKLFNTLPKNVRDLSNVNVDTFKRQLDKFLQDLPDEPPIPGYHRRALSNSVVDQVALMRADGRHWWYWRPSGAIKALRLPSGPQYMQIELYFECITYV